MAVVMESDEPSRRKHHSKYEKEALLQIHAWKSPKRTWLDSVTDVVSWPFTKALSFLEGTPVWPVVSASFSGVLTLINSWSQWSVQPDAIIQEYQAGEGPEVRTLADIQELDLSVVDRAIGMLDVKYEGLALVQGAATNATSTVIPPAAIAAIPTDIAALLGLCLRAIGEYATYCGFDVRDERERMFALQILAYASSPSDAAKAIVMAQLVKVAQDVALKKSWEHLNKQIIVQAAQELAKALSVRLTKAKLAQLVPVAGIIVGGTYNAYYADKVCRAAFYLYRERFLAAKYGVKDIEATVPPAKDVELAPVSLDIHLSREDRRWMLPGCREISSAIGLMWMMCLWAGWAGVARPGHPQATARPGWGRWRQASAGALRASGRWCFA